MLRSQSEIWPAEAQIGDQVGRLESILFEDRRWLVLKWVVDGERMWPRRLVLIDHLEFEIQRNPELLVIVHSPLPADAMPEAEPHETARMTRVVDYPAAFFEPRRVQ